MNRPPHLVLALCPVILGNNNAGSDSNSHEHSNNQVDKRRAGPYRRQGFTADELPHNNGIHRVVKLLEQIAYQ